MNTYTPKLYEALYVSSLPEGSSLRTIADIAAASRVANVEAEITGLLVFDGSRFCQQIEGRQKAVLKLLEKISLDLRHENVQILHHQFLEKRRFSRFSLGYTMIEDDIDTLENLEKIEGPAAFDVFMKMLPSLDLDSEM